MIEIENVWKQYKLGNTVNIQQSFREALTQKFSRHKEKPESHDEFWALRDINLSVKAGQTLGLIGHNGAGKSTLLKVLSRITKPTKGKITVHGSLSSLLEVGTGFHPELSGRENIYLYGAIMGMSKRDITKKFDEIVDYAGVERFLDTPVKRYSSGMYVRLAFSIAAHVEPDILVVDEVLAVGDKEFRDKCLGKMDEVAQSGRTVIFVSHNMSSIASLCKDVAWMDRGQIREIGEAQAVISSYENSLGDSSSQERASMLFGGSLKDLLSLESLTVQGISDSYLTTVKSDEPITIKANWKAKTHLDQLGVHISLYDEDTRLLTINDHDLGQDAAAGTFSTEFKIPANTFRNANISIAIGATELSNLSRWSWAPGIAKLNIVCSDTSNAGHPSDLLSPGGNAIRTRR